MKGVRVASLLLAALLGAVAWAQASSDAGTEPALYLGTGARAAALGRTGATETGSGAAADWNPAGLGQVPRMELLLQHAPLYDGARHDTLGFAYPILDWGTVNVGWMRLELGDIERRDADNLPGGFFNFQEQQVAVSYGREVWGPLSLGLTLKALDVYLDGRQSTSPGADAGWLLRFPRPLAPAEENAPAARPNTPAACLAAGADLIREVRFGAVVTNAVGPQIKLLYDAERLNPVYRLGAALDLNLLADFPNTLSLRVDGEKSEHADWRAHAGAEFSFCGHYALRAGWDNEYAAAGAGLAFAGVTLDYAVSFPEIGLRHLLTLSAAFGDDLRDLQARRKADEARQRQLVVEKLKSGIVADYDRQAKAQAAEGNYREAVKLWEKVLDWDPDNHETQENVKHARAEIQRQEIAAILQNADKYFREERYVEAMVECRRVLELEAGNAAASELYARAEKKATTLGELAFAKEVKALARIREHYLLGLKAYASRQWEEAIKNWEEVIADSPMQKQVYQYLAQAREQYEKSKAGTTVRVQGVSAAEQKRQDLYKQAVSLSTSGKLKDATMTWEKLLKENPKDEDAKKNLDKTRQDLINSEKHGIRW
jgi:tetratricopeptide (TPR) repeat protein